MFTEAQILQALASLEEIEPTRRPVPVPQRIHCGTCYQSTEGPGLPIGWSRSWRSNVVFCNACNAFVDETRALDRDDGGEW